MSNYKLIFSKRFKKDYKKFKKDATKFKLIDVCLGLLLEDGVSAIPPEMHPHKLKGKYKDMLEFHIQPDLLIIWFQIDEPTKEIRLIRLGSHAELF